MATQRIIWTVLPNGIDGAARKLSVLVSPRLEVSTPTTLDAFADFRDWPTRSLTFTLKFESVPPGQTKEVTVAAPLHQRLDQCGGGERAPDRSTRVVETVED